VPKSSRIVSLLVVFQILLTSGQALAYYRKAPIQVSVVHPSDHRSEELFEQIHSGPQSKFVLQAYNHNVGFISSTPALILSPGPRSKPIHTNLRLGRVVILSGLHYLPQNHPIYGYGPYYIQTSGNWICWIYQSMGIGPDYGERIYAYNFKTNKEVNIWKSTSGSNEQIFEFQLVGNTLYYGTQLSHGPTVVTMVHSADLNKNNQRIAIKTVGEGSMPVIEDFSVSRGILGLLWTSAIHFVPDGYGPETYHFTLNALNGKLLRTIFTGTDVDSFNFASNDGLWVWSDHKQGVHFFKLGTNKVWVLSNDNSYVRTDGHYVWWTGIDDLKSGGFDTRNGRFIRSKVLKPRTFVFYSDSLDVFINGLTSSWIHV